MMVFLFLAAVAEAPSRPAELPNFSFKEHRTNGIYSLDSLRAAKGCKQDAGGEFSCSLTDAVAGRWAVIFYHVNRDMRLTSLSFSGFREGIPDVLASLRTRYGLPCESGREEFVNGLGNRIPVETLTWCFRTGKLIFRERSGRVDSWGATYTDEVARPNMPPGRVDF